MLTIFSARPVGVSYPIIVFLIVSLANVANAQCPGLGSITFNVVAAPEPTLDFPPSICSGQSATVAVNETFSSYLWSTGGTASSIIVNQSGIYTVTVTNSAGCEGTASANIMATDANG